MAYLGTFDAYWIDLPNNQIYKVDFQHHSDFIRNNANLLPDPAEAQRNPYKAAYDSGWVHLVYNYENQESNIEGHEDKIKASWRKVKSTLLKSKRIYVDIVKPGKREATKQKEFGLPHQRDKVFMYFTGQADPTSVRIESLMERMGIDIEINADKYADYVSYYLEELQASSQRRFDAGHTQHLYSKEETERDVSALIGGTMENMKVMKEKISSMYAKFSTKWQGTTLLIMPHFNKGNDFSFNPCDDFTIKFGTHPYAPDFTLFDMGSMIEDVLDAGDKDFFVDNSVESDYFTLVQAFQDPGIFDVGEKVLTLFTARPREQRGIYDGSSTIPTDIFLTNDPDEAFGYAQDMNGRDVYKIKVKQKYLVKTLDAGSKKNYQTVNGPSGMVPIDLIDRLTEGFTQHIVENISWETWWFHPEKGIITLNGAENQHWWYVIEHYKKMGIDIGTIVQKYNGDMDALYDDDHDWYAIKTNAYKAGWVRMGLINGSKAYVNSLQKVPAKAAANWLYNKSDGHMTSLELEICSQKVNVRLRDDMLEKFLSKGIIGKGAEKLDENEMSIASFRGYAGWFRNDVGLVQVDFIHGDADWLKFSHFSPGKDVSPYKGVWISTMLGVLAKMKKIWQWPQHDVEKPTDRLARAGWSYDLEQGLKISAKAQKKSGMGMSEMDPDEWESYVGKKWPESNPPRLPRVGYIKTPDDVVRILIGDGVTPKHIQTFEDLWNVVKRKSLDGDGTIPFTSEQIKQRFAEALVRSSTGKDFKNLDEILNASVFQDKKAA